MSGVAFVRELPQGERIVGLIETTVFSYEEKKSLEELQEKHKGKIKIDPEVLKKHQQLYRDGVGLKVDIIYFNTITLVSYNNI